MTPPAVIGAVGDVLGPLLGAFECVAWVQRCLHPPLAGLLAEALAPHGKAVSGPADALAAAACPDDLRFVRDRVVEVARQSVVLVEAFVEAARSPGDFIGLYRALRRFAGIQETLYPLASVLEPVGRWFLEPGRRDDLALIERLRVAACRDDDVRVGVLHANNERGSRGGFSLYVPETCEKTAPMPLVVALHGGHGHGRDFLWSWLAEARSRGVLVLAPTSRDRTWSIMGGRDEDADGLRQMVDSVAGRYPVDREHILLTGMSDGATYALLCGLREDMPFTYLAPVSGVLHPFLFTGGGIARARGRPIYLVHGALDWMFPVQTAHVTRDTLAQAGARLVYREIEDLSHTYPRDENPRILDWLTSASG